MRIGDKIKMLMTQRGFKSINALHKAMQAVFEKETLSRRSLSTLFNKDIKLRESHIFQFTLIMGVKRSELIKDTCLEKQLTNTPPAFPYSDRAVLYCLDKTAAFALMKLKLQSNSRTSQEQDPASSTASAKSVTILIGKLTILLKKNETERRMTLRKGQTYSFDARQAHHFENSFDRTSEALIIHAPVENSVFFAS